MDSLVIQKQLIINSMALPIELIHEVKDYLFYDKLSTESRNKKRGLINQFKLGLWYQPDFEQGHWALAFRYERQMQAINCVCCGQFVGINSDQEFPVTMACYCDEHYVEEIMEQVRGKMNFNSGVNLAAYMTRRMNEYALELIN